ncbi:MAG: arylsulfotransferase family protein [Vicinamibacterales bacterium]
MTPGRRDWSKIAFIVSAFLMAFGYGFVVGAQNVFPYSIVHFAIDSVRQLRTWRSQFGVRPDAYLQRARYPGAGVTRDVDGRVSPGLTLLIGFFGSTNEARLIRADGRVVRRWPLSFSALFPDPTHVLPESDRPKSDWNVDPHDGLALHDGSIVFNFENLGVAKLDRCGGVAWTLPRMAHHVISPNDDGTFWIGGRRYVEGESPYPHIKTPFLDETAMRVSADGQVLQELSVLKALLLGAPGLYFGGLSNQVPRGETLHLNDIDELPASLAARFPQFQAGDLLLSMRDLSLLMVLRPSTEEVVWRRVGRWIRQHDPDFLPNGHISIFSNNPMAAAEGPAHVDQWPDPLGSSTILDLDPVTGVTSLVYGRGSGQAFYTAFRGKHERLPNGDLLVVESNAGHVFEVDQEGALVWEYVNRYDETNTAVVYQAHRYADDYFTVSDWTCPATTH